MEAERTKRKPLDRDHWMAKFQVWCFGSLTPEFVGYCPFFWFTWMCVLLFPAILAGKLVERLSRPITYLLAAGYNYLGPKTPRKYAIYSFWEAIKHHGEKMVFQEFHHYDDVIAWANRTPDWREIAQKIYEKRKARIEEDQKYEITAMVRQGKRRAVLKKFANKAHYVVKPLLILFGLGLLSAALYLVFLFTKLITLQMLLGGAEFVALVFTACLALSLLWSVVAFFIGFLRKRPTKPSRDWSWLKNALIMIFGGPLVVIFRVLEFLAETIGMIYLRECPLIEWGDKTESIQKIKP